MQLMKAAVHYEYGEPDLVRLAELPKPDCPADGYVIRVRACSVNPADWKYIHGNWRWVTGNRFPRQIGADFAGIVDAAGPRARRWQSGDRVMGSVNPFKTGTAAEFVAVGENQLWAMPDGLDFHEAAGIPIAGGTAYIGFCSGRADIAGKDVLITGSGGGVGHLAVQLAKHLGARVTAVCSEGKREFSIALGADEAIDYRETDVSRSDRRFDVILDCAASLDYATAKPILNPGGEYLLLELNGRLWLFATAALSRVFSTRTMRTYLASPSSARCQALKALFDSRTLRMTVSRRFPLEQAGTALAELKDGHAKGKIVIEML
jgi:NADPH:quinone reductase-like Zn-dependent oxidoreductase